MARGLVKLEAKAEARSCLAQGKHILEPMNLQHVKMALQEVETALL